MYVSVNKVPPGPPIPRVVDTGKDSVILAWKPPLYNGGGDILGYHVEKVLNILTKTCKTKNIQV